MSKRNAQAFALVLTLIALPLVSLGSSQDIGWLWRLGLTTLILGGLIPPAARYAIADRSDSD